MPFFEDQENGRICLEAGKYASALEYFGKAEQSANTDDEIATVNIYMGDIFFEQGRYEQAIEKYSRAAQLGDNEHKANALLSRGNVKVKMGYLEMAIEDFRMARQLNPEFCQAYFNEGDAYFEMGDRQNAFNSYYIAIENLSKLNKPYAYVHRAEKWNAIGGYEQAEFDGMFAGDNWSSDLKTDKFKKLEEKLDTRRAISKGNIEEDIQDLNAISQEMLEICDTAMGKYKNHKFEYMNNEVRYFKIQSTKKRIFEKMGDWYKANNMDDMAIANYDKAENAVCKLLQNVFGYSSDGFKFLIKKGIILSQMNQPEKAILTLENASRFAKSDVQKTEYLKQIGDCYMQMNQIDMAIPKYTMAINKNTSPQENAILLAKRGSAYWRDNKVEQGQADFDEMGKINISGEIKEQCSEIYAQALMLEGDKMLEGQNFNMGFNLYQKATDIAPIHQKSKSVTHSAVQRFKIGKFQEGFNECESAIKFAKTEKDKAVAYTEKSWGHYLQQDLEQAKQMAIYANQFEKNETTKELLSAMELAYDTHEINKAVLNKVTESFGAQMEIPGTDAAEQCPWKGFQEEFTKRTFDNGKKTAVIKKIKPIWEPLKLEPDRMMQ